MAHTENFEFSIDVDSVKVFRNEEYVGVVVTLGDGAADLSSEEARKLGEYLICAADELDGLR